MNRLATIFLLLILSLCSFASAEITPESLPVPTGRAAGISDPAGLLSPDARSALSSQLEALDRTATVGGAVAILPSTGEYSPQEFATLLFEHWKPGYKDKDNGFLLLVAIEERQAFICTGYGLEGVLPDAVCSELLRKYFVPQMRADNLFGAISDSLGAISKILSDPQNRDEVLSRQGADQSPQALSDGEFWEILGFIISAVALFVLALFCFDLFKSRGDNQYSKALRWRSHLSYYWLGTLFSLGLAFPFPLIALWLTRHYRSKRIKCDTCGAKMNKLNEEEDNELLSASQDLEEKLNTVDYDVWVCPDCGTIERFPFRPPQKEYTECPNCHTVAQHVVLDKVVIPATTRHAGQGERFYKCEYCGNQHSRKYTIPRRQDNSALLAAAAIGAAASRGGHSNGGGGWGGGFGGGMTGGGGGGASW